MAYSTARSTLGGLPDPLNAITRGHRQGRRQARPLAQLDIRVSDPHMGRIEDGPFIVMHMIGYYFMDADTRHTLSAQ